jgi:alkanesulfonate monooxygenase SsuD/methylene tetrahydromethanopterin reductase-like flavin-dependent oxidoreductase (luciferase family)
MSAYQQFHTAMPKIGFHASHEQFSPSELLELVQAAEAAGFDCAMSSDHFRPWGPSQGQSGYAGSPSHQTAYRGHFGAWLSLSPGDNRPSGSNVRGDVPGTYLARPW